MAYRREKVKDKSRKTQRRKVENIRRPTALLEENEEPDDQIYDTDEVYVDSTRRPLMNSSQVRQVSVVEPSFRGKRRAFHQVMHFAAGPYLIQVDLNVPGANDRAASLTFIETNRNQPIPRQQPGLVAGRSAFDRIRDYPLLSVNPLDAVPGRRFVPHTLAEIERTGTDQQDGAYQQ